MSLRQIKVCAGIGDNIWLLQKLVNAPNHERFLFDLPDGEPQRGKQIFDLCPQVSAEARYIPGLSYGKIYSHNIQNTHAFFRDIEERDFFLSCNHHLETGKRIEDFLPDLDTSFRMNWNTNGCVSPLVTGKKYIGIYTSAYSTVRSWGFWNEYKWIQLIKLVNRHNPDYVFVIIGAKWDTDLSTKLMHQLDKYGIAYVNTIGQNLGTVIEMMKQLKYFFSFPSGLGILAPTVACPVAMFYPPHLVPMINAWASLEDIESGLYKGCQFCEPHHIFEWAAKNNKI